MPHPPKTAHSNTPPHDNRCVRLEAALRRMVSVWHQSTARAIRKHKDQSALLCLSRYFDVIHWPFCTALLQVEHTSLCHCVGRFAKLFSNVYVMKAGGTIILAVVLSLPPAPCPGDAVFHCESKSTLLRLPKEDTTRNQWLCLQHCSRTVQHKYSSVCSTFYGGVFPEPGRVAYNASGAQRLFL